MIACQGRHVLRSLLQGQMNTLGRIDAGVWYSWIKYVKAGRIFYAGRLLTNEIIPQASSGSVLEHVFIEDYDGDLLPMQRRVNRALRQRLYEYIVPPNNLFSKPKQLTSLSSATTSRQTESRVSPSLYEEEPNKSTQACRVYNVKDGLVPYEEAWLCQQRLLQERIAWQREKSMSLPDRDVLLLLEHPPVYTLGRGSTLDNLKFDPDDPACRHEVRRTERGGEVTWHGPGQIVGYPVLDLNYHKKDLHWYLRQLEEVIIRVLARYHLQGERESDHTGVWVGGAKVAAIGLNATRWITSHGFALNVCPNLEAFEEIVPCGIQGRPVTRLCDLTSSLGSFEGGSSSSRAMRAVRSQVVEEFAHVFGVEVEVEDIEANTGGLENALFPKECEPKLLERLRGDGRRQLELTRKKD